MDTDPRTVLDAFNAAWNAHDLAAAIDLCDDGIVFESTDPAPDGRRFVGKEAVRDAWSGVFAQENGRFEIEEVLPSTGDRLVQRWRYDWGTGHVRGVDVMTLRAGLIVEKLSYVKG